MGNTRTWALGWDWRFRGWSQKPWIKIQGYKMLRADGSFVAKLMRAIGSGHFVGMEFIPSVMVQKGFSPTILFGSDEDNAFA